MKYELDTSRIYEETRKYVEVAEGRDIEPGGAVPREGFVAQLAEEGYGKERAREILTLAEERGDLERVEGGVRPASVETTGEDAEVTRSKGGSSPAQSDEDGEKNVVRARVLEAFETAVEFYHEHLDDELPEACDVDADTAREYFEEGRGWEAETVDEKRLGYAPAGHAHELLDRLMRDGFDREEILGTGLFYDLETAHFEGRVVLPYFDEDGRPCYAISRTVGHPDDPKANQKYTKAVKTKEYSHVDEPIYGLDTVDEETETVLVAEGIADAITAHERGYAAVSPVTTQFKRKHHDVVLDAVEDVDRVVVVADNDAVGSDVNDDGLLELPQHGEGLKGALRTAGFLNKNGVDARVALPPTLARHDNDLDEFLGDGWGTLDKLVATAKPPEQFDAYEDVRETREDAVERAREMLDETEGSRSAIFDLRLSDVLGVSEGFRGKNPLGHRGTRESYFVVVDGGVAYDHKRKKAYNGLTALLVDAGVRSVDAPDGRLDDAEVFEAWGYAKEERIIPDDDPIPYRALLHVARAHGLDDPDEIPDGYANDETLRCYNDALATVREEYGLDPGREDVTREKAESGGEEYADDPTESKVVLDARRAWDAATRVSPEDLDAPLGLATDGDVWNAEGEAVGDVARAVAYAEGLVDAPDEPLTEEYAKAYALAREKYGAPLPEYLTNEDTVMRHDAAFGAVKELSYWHLDEDTLNAEVTARDGEVSGDAVRTLDPSPLDGWRESESGESVLVFESGTIWDADLGEDGRVVDPLRFVAVDAGLVDDPTALLEGEEYVEAYDLARTEYGAPLPRWEVGTPDVTPVLPPADELVEDVEDPRREIDKLRDETAELYRETVRDADEGVDVLRCLPALGKTTASIKHAVEKPTAYLAPRKELMRDAEEKAEDAGASVAHLPVFSSATVDREILDDAVVEIREGGKDGLRDPWAFFEKANETDGDLFGEEDGDEITLDRPTCPTAEGEHGDAWALAVHVARELDYTPRDVHERAKAIFGRPLPCQHDGDCEYSEGWDAVTDPDACPDLLVGHYTHAHVESARTYYEPDGDGGVDRSARAVVIDEFPNDAYAEEFGGEAVEHALWLARCLRGDVEDRQDLMENDLWGDGFVRSWLRGELEDAETPEAEKVVDAAAALGVRAELLEAAEDAEEILDAGEDLLEEYDLAEEVRRFADDPLAFNGGAFSKEDRTAEGLADEIRLALDEIPAEHGGVGILEWLNDTVGAAVGKAARLDTNAVEVDELPVAGELREFVERADKTRDAGLTRSAAAALRGGETGTRELSVWASSGYAHRKANLLLEAGIRPTDDGAAKIPTEQYDYGDREEDGTTLKHVEVGEKTVVLWDRNHKGAEILTPPSRTAGDGSTCPLVGLDATARRRLWRVSLGDNVQIRDVHESRAERARALREVHGLQVVQTSERAKAYEGDPSGKNLDGDVALLEEIRDEFSGVHAAREREEESVTVDDPTVITTKCVREVLEDDNRLGGVVAGWENYGNVKGSNELGETNIAALLGSQHYGDAAVERFAAFAGEEITRVGYGNALEYGSATADEYLGHMREDQVMQAVLRFARGGSGALVFAHTSALRDDLPVVGRGEVVRSWSEKATTVAEELRKVKGEEVTVRDVADGVDVSKRHVGRILNEFASAGYVEKRESGTGRANGYTPVDAPGAGEVEINAEVDGEGLRDPDGADSNTVYTVSVGVHPVDTPELPRKPRSRSSLPSPDASDGVLVEGDPPE